MYVSYLFAGIVEAFDSFPPFFARIYFIRICMQVPRNVFFASQKLFAELLHSKYLGCWRSRNSVFIKISLTKREKYSHEMIQKIHFGFGGEHDYLG